MADHSLIDALRADIDFRLNHLIIIRVFPSYHGQVVRSQMFWLSSVHSECSPAHLLLCLHILRHHWTKDWLLAQYPRMGSSPSLLCSSVLAWADGGSPGKDKQYQDTVYILVWLGGFGWVEEAGPWDLSLQPSSRLQAWSGGRQVRQRGEVPHGPADVCRLHRVLLRQADHHPLWDPGRLPLPHSWLVQVSLPGDRTACLCPGGHPRPAHASDCCRSLSCRLPGVHPLQIRILRLHLPWMDW